MATAASDDEQEVEVVPAAPDPDPDPEQQQARDVTAHQGSEKEAAVATKMDAAVATQIEARLSELEPLRARISRLLGAAGGPQRDGVVTGDIERSLLAFLGSELSVSAAFFKALLSSQHLDGETMNLLKDLLHSFCVYVHISADHKAGVVNRVDPSNDTLLRRASRWFQFQRGKSSSYLAFLFTSVWFYRTNERFQYLHLRLTSSDRGLTPKLAEAGALLPLVGIDRRAKKILRWLTHQGNMDTSLRVMSIVGPVGIGKTTLAVELCSRLRQHETSGGRYYFQCKAMAQASRGTDRNIRLLQDILSQVSQPAGSSLSSDPSQAKTMEVLVHLISEHLRDKRYFIIIDDMHDASDWEEIKGAFPADSKNLGSRILITTRITSIAEKCCSSYFYDGLVHKMKPLNEIESERLLLAKAVGSKDGCLPDNMKLRCDEILRRCDGIPLFIIGMADWLEEQLLKEQLLQQLHQRESKDREHERFPMHYEEQVPRLPERLEQALSSAFNDFPNDGLRAVLLYMSMFPYGYKFEKGRLMIKWMHEGFTHYTTYRDDFEFDAMLEVETFFSQLVDRNFITHVASNCKYKQDEDGACLWQLNHFVHQFLASNSAEIGFIFTTTTISLLAATSSRMPRRLALHHPDPQLLSLLETLDLSQTRSLSVSGTVNGIPLEKFVNLVVLDLEGWENLKDEDLLQVCRSKMLYLNFLSVRNTQVTKLPREIMELWMLKTLDISYTQITELPHELSKLRLWHLDLRGTRISQLPKQIVDELQDYLVALLVGGEGIINSVKMEYVVRLYKLQILATVDLTEHPSSFFVRALGSLRKLQVLVVAWSFQLSTDKDYREAFLASITKWEDLKSLTIHCGFGCSMEFLGSLENSHAPQRLEKFKVTAGRFASVPRWIGGLKCLAFVQITICNKQTTMDDLKILGELPTLQCLILGLDFIPGQAIVVGNEGFSELQRFLIECPMPWLTFSRGAMQKLAYLQLKFYSTPASQTCVPSGISNLSRLTEVALCYNSKYDNSASIKMTVEAVTRQVAKHRNPIDLFINGIEQDYVQEADDEVTEVTIGTSSSTNNARAEDDAQAVGEDATAEIECEITEAES